MGAFIQSWRELWGFERGRRGSISVGSPSDVDVAIHEWLAVSNSQIDAS